MKNKFFRLLAIFVLAFTVQILLPACNTVPYTDRTRFLVTGAGYENQLGLESWTEICGAEKESTNTKLIALVQRVGNRIASVAEQNNFKWEFKVFDSETANAFCLPGGKVAVYTGIIDYMDNEAELAIVIGHEIGHAIARHGGERISQSIVQAGGAATLSLMLGDSKSSSLALAAYGIVTEYGVMLPYSRTHEYESDIIGIILMAKAGYDPNASITFWQKFGSNSSAPEFLSTHPLGENRIKKMQEYLPEAMQYYNKSSVKYGTGEKITHSKK